jgi:hypothetical protein
MEQKGAIRERKGKERNGKEWKITLDNMEIGKDVAMVTTAITFSGCRHDISFGEHRVKCFNIRD